MMRLGGMPPEFFAKAATDLLKIRVKEALMSRAETIVDEVTDQVISDLNAVSYQEHNMSSFVEKFVVELRDKRA